MLSAMFSGMHRYTRSSSYVNRKKMKQTIRASRPGNQGFVFTGDDFPGERDWLPVEAVRQPRSYMQPVGPGSVNDSVRSQVNERVPVISRYGVRMNVAIVMLALFALLLCGVWMCFYAGNAGASSRLAEQAVRMESLQQTSVTLESEIAMRSSGINVRQEATRIGLKSSRGMSMNYISVPSAAEVNPATYGLRQDVASLLGQ
ncbi:MAG: hypothetical protein IJE07_03960 [Clostridia bacterium]|nr:hypothetical protein [Clostridia bacterium]